MENSCALMNSMKANEKVAISQGAPTRSLDKLALLSQLSRLQNCDKINVHCLSNPDSGVLFGQCKKMISNIPALLKTETI